MTLQRTRGVLRRLERPDYGREEGRPSPRHFRTPCDFAVTGLLSNRAFVIGTDSGDYSTATAAIFAARPPDYSGFGRTGRTKRMKPTSRRSASGPPAGGLSAVPLGGK